MVNENIAKAATEVLDILKHTKKSDVEKIPQEFIEFLEQIKDKNYNVDLDYNKLMSDMNLSPLTESLLGVIYMKYWASEEDKKVFIQKLKNNQIQFEVNNKKQERFDNTQNLQNSSDDISKNDVEKTNVQEKYEDAENNDEVDDKEKNTLPDVVRHKNIIQRIIDRIISIFRRKRD